jgi:hypothetical protein
MAVSKKAVELTRNYIAQDAFNKMNDTEKSRKDIMLDAGYSNAMAESKDPKRTDIYAELSTKLINKVSFALFEMVDEIDKRVKSEEHKTLSLQDLIKQASILTTLYKGITPSFKQKTTTKDDTGYSTTWTTLN